jgi:hypothetical protein
MNLGMKAKTMIKRGNGRCYPNAHECIWKRKIGAFELNFSQVHNNANSEVIRINYGRPTCLCFPSFFCEIVEMLQLSTS